MYRTDKDEKAPLNADGKASTKKADTKALIGLAEAVKLSASLSAITLESTKGSTLPIETLKGGDKKARIVDLARKGLSFISAIFIGVLMRGNTHVTELVLNSNDVTASGATGIVQQLSKSIKVLDISNVVLAEDRSKADKKDKKAVSAAAVTIPPQRLAELWSAVSALGALDKLDRLTMDRNHMTSLDSFAKLTSLKTLSLSNNRELDSLEKIDVRSNQLTYLPLSLAQLKNLKLVDASDNLLQSLHPSICDLHAVERLELKDNPLARPPSAIARNGIGAIRKFFQEAIMVNEMVSYAARLVLLGAAGGGKTSLQRGMRFGKAAPTEEDESTAHADVHAIELGEGAKQVTLSVWDLGGDSAGLPAVQPYLTEGSIYLLAVPALDVPTLSAGYATYVGQWLDCLHARAPKAAVLPVLTKCDTLNAASNPGPEHRTPSAYSNFASTQVAWLTEALQRHQSSVPDGGLNIHYPVQCASALSGSEAAIDGVKARMSAIVFADGGSVLPSIYQPIPRTIYLTMVLLRALRDGRDPIDSARTADQGYMPSTMDLSVELTTSPRPVIAYSSVQTRYIEEFAPVLKMAPNSDGLDTALTLLQHQGEMATLPSGLIMLAPGYMTRLFKPLVTAQMGKAFIEARRDTLRSTVALGRSMLEVERQTILAAAERFHGSAILQEELLITLWQTEGVRQGTIGDMASTFRRMGLIALSAHTEHGRSWLMPTRLPADEPSYFGRPSAAAVERAQAWQALTAVPDVEVLAVALPIGAVLPAGLFERLVVACGDLGSYVKCWNGGAQLCLVPPKTADGHGSLHALVQLRSRAPPAGEAADGALVSAGQSHEVTIECCAPRAMRNDAWAYAVAIRGVFRSLLNALPGLGTPGTATLCCPGCTARMTSQEEMVTSATAAQAEVEGHPSLEPTLWPLESVLAQSQKCDVCNEKVSLHSAPLREEVAPPASLVRRDEALGPHARSSLSQNSFCLRELRYGRPVEVFTSLYGLLGLANGEEVERLRAGGETSIVDEFEAEAEASPATTWSSDERGRYGWSELDWCLYLSAAKADAAATANDDAARARAERVASLRQEARDKGLVDAGRKDPTLDFFLKRPETVAAGLSRGQVLALRLVASPVGLKINRALHNGCDARRPHPYPATCVQLLDGLSKLWTSQLDQRLAASKAAATAAEEARVARLSGDEEVIAAADTVAKKAAAESEALQIDALWHGVGELDAKTFKERGATEIGFLRSSDSRELAQAQAVEQLQRRLAALPVTEQQPVAAAAGGAARPAEGAARPDGSAEEAVEGSGGRSVDGGRRGGLAMWMDAAEAAIEVGLEAGACEGGAERGEGADPQEGDEEAVFLPLATASGPGGALPRATLSPIDDAGADSTVPDGGAAAPLVVPVLLLRIERSELSVVNLSFLSPLSSSEFCLPPGTYLEQRKEAIEAIPFGGRGEELEIKVLDVALHLPPSIAKQAAAHADARAEGKAARSNTGGGV